MFGGITRFLRRMAFAAAATCAACAWPLESEAHDPGLSSADIIVGSRRVTVRVSFAPGDVSALATGNEPFTAAAAAEWEIGGKAIPPTEVETVQMGQDYVEFRLVFPRGKETGGSFRSTLLDSLPTGHRQVLTVRNGVGEPIVSRLLHAGRSRAAILLTHRPESLAAPLPTAPWMRFMTWAAVSVATAIGCFLYWRSRWSVQTAAGRFRS